MARLTPAERAELQAELAQVRADKARLEALLAWQAGDGPEPAPPAQLLLPVERAPRDDNPGE